jgi:type I restriction enzyme S subunit
MSPNMNHETSPALVPKLRFPEFRAAEPWREITIASILKVRDTRRVPSAEAPLFSLTIENGITKKSDRYDREFLVRDAGNKTYKLVEPSDIVYNPSNLRWGAISYSQLSHPVVVSPIYEVLSLVNDSEVFCFVATSVMRDAQIRRCITKAQGTLVERIAVKIDDFLSTNLPVPPGRPEQQRIADCLGSLDELVAAQARKVEALKAHKKGLMQQLFPQEGETQPRLRFPEFQDAGEWVETTIGDLKPFVTSGSRGWAPFYAEKGELFVRMTNLWRDSIHLDLTDLKFVQLPPGANEGVRTQLKEHDVLISITADIGIIGYVDESVPSPAYINQHIALARFDAGQLCGKYIAYFLASEESQRLFRASTDTGTKAGMSLIGVQKIGLMLPGLPEQQRIADCLSSLDDLITAESTKLNALKTHKTGLMQQLFPTPAEVNA